jgi:hypothetical protein
MIMLSLFIYVDSNYITRMRILAFMDVRTEVQLGMNTANIETQLVQLRRAGIMQM